MQLIRKSVGMIMKIETARIARGTFGLVRPIFVGSVAAFAAVTSAGLAGWGLVGVLVLAVIAWIDGLILTAYLQTKDDNGV